MRFETLWKEQQKVVVEIGNAEPTRLERWKALFLRCLFSADPHDIEASTKGQAKADEWFLERIFRVTASKCKLICTRKRDFMSLCKQLLYVTPPTHLPALEYGRRKEPEAVQRYADAFPRRCVSECGLIVKPDAMFLAASPDRLVVDPDAVSKEGLLEVKCPFATSDPPRSAARAKKGFCLKEENGNVRLNRSHQYFYQVKSILQNFVWCIVACVERNSSQSTIFICSLIHIWRGHHSSGTLFSLRHTQ